MSKVVKNGVNPEDKVIQEESIEETENSDKNGYTNGVSDFRDNKGRFTSGNSFGQGRPPANETIVQKFRDNPKGQDILNSIFKIANTLGTDSQHKDAMNCTKLIIERLIPALKSSELKIDTDENKGFVILPAQKKPESE